MHSEPLSFCSRQNSSSWGVTCRVLLGTIIKNAMATALRLPFFGLSFSVDIKCVHGSDDPQTAVARFWCIRSCFVFQPLYGGAVGVKNSVAYSYVAANTRKWEREEWDVDMVESTRQPPVGSAYRPEGGTPARPRFAFHSLHSRSLALLLSRHIWKIVEDMKHFIRV